MCLDILQKVMIENGLAIRAIPITSKAVVEIRNKDRFPIFRNPGG